GVRSFIRAFRTPHSAFCISFEFPVLRGARLAEVIKSADADERLHFFRQGLNAQDKISQRGKCAAAAFAQDRFFGAEGQAFDVKKWDTDGGKAEIRRPKSEGNPKSE